MNIIFVNIVVSDDYVSLIQCVKIYFNINIRFLLLLNLPTFVIKERHVVNVNKALPLLSLP